MKRTQLLFLRTPQVFTLMLVFLIFCAPNTTKAHNINQSDVVDGLFFQNLGFATIESTGGIGAFSHQTGSAPAFVGLGLGGGFVSGEIDNIFLTPGREQITIIYAVPTTIQEITLGFLRCAACGFGDAVNEKALVIADGVTQSLTATAADAALWTGPGIVNIVSAVDGFFQISNPFGGGAVTRLDFLAQLDVNSAAGSDFSIVSVSQVLSQVPEPGSLLLLGTGLLGLLIYNWRYRHGAV